MKKEIIFTLALIFVFFVVKSQEVNTSRSIVAPYLDYKISLASETF